MSEERNICIDFDIEETARVILRENCKKIALQFPDEMLDCADLVASHLRNQLPEDCNIYILGDTSVCACCVDTVALEHVNADLVVHYGDACMSRIRGIPVYYVFERSTIDIKSCVEAVREKIGGSTKTVYLSYDLSFYHCIDKLYSELKPIIPNVMKGEIIRSQNLSDSEQFGSDYIKLGYHYFPVPERDPNAILLFIAKDNADINNYYVNGNLFSVLLDSGLPQALVYTDYQICKVSPNKFLMQRYVNIERVEKLSMVGIIVGTLSVNRYRQMMDMLTTLAEENDQQAYPIMVGKLNLPKLANFPGMEGFILIGCERSCFMDTREYPFPIVMPYEYMISIGKCEWGNLYIHDYTQLLGEEEEQEVDDSDRIHTSSNSACEESQGGQIIAFESKVLDYINKQHYHGLV